MRKLSFVLGVLVLVICVAVPLPRFDSGMPFSAHMVRHTALLLLAAPMLAMAIPAGKFATDRLAALSRITAQFPFVAWLTGILVMWAWHVPALYNATAGVGTGILACAPLSPTLLPHGSAAHPAAVAALSIPWMSARAIPLLHDLSMLLAGFLFCWPVVTPFRAMRLPVLRGVLYLATACVCCSLLGLLITFAPQGTYHGVGPEDQQTGGMIMWIPCCFVYLTASMVLLIRWLSGKEPATQVSI
ncbi:MAG TPA: cytochrome c oxidase assembly protein [Puia sp.]|nr:cytochrome c oxidase assembly protein [Puia sp.]